MEEKGRIFRMVHVVVDWASISKTQQFQKEAGNTSHENRYSTMN
jgi:hypothetical protein